MFTGLENAFAGPGWAWKPHKSKDQIFLHRNYVQKNLNSEKNILDQKYFERYAFSASKLLTVFFISDFFPELEIWGVISEDYGKSP